MAACAALGYDQSDHSALVKSIEALANHKVAPDA
jgi:2-hydroxy-3-oxopropionate reductase